MTTFLTPSVNFVANVLLIFVAFDATAITECHLISAFNKVRISLYSFLAITLWYPY